MEDENNKIEILGNFAALLSLVEIGLGSFLHVLRIPFSGILLSLNQGYLLCRLTLMTKNDEKNEWAAFSVSNISAILKSLSPAGKKLGPMMSLSMQGFLFNLGSFLFGKNLLGMIIGMTLLSLWTFIQPVITYYLFFGEKLFGALEFLYEKSLPYHQIKPSSLIWFFIFLVVVKIISSWGLAIFAWKNQNKKLYPENYEEKFLKWGREKLSKKKIGESKAFFLACKDLLNPLFIFSIILTAFFLYFGNYGKSEISWYLLRPIAIGFIFFYISRTLTLDRLLKKCEGGVFNSFSISCQSALAKIRELI